MMVIDWKAKGDKLAEAVERFLRDGSVWKLSQARADYRKEEVKETGHYDLEAVAKAREKKVDE